MKLYSNNKLIFFSIILVLFYLISHLGGLTRLPVFADEAIYIRWAQLILSDPQQYFFFPLNDGKTPLFIWQLAPLLPMFKDPLFAARLVSVIGGLIQVGAMVLLIKELKGGVIAQKVGAVLVVFLPFWLFHHRMALMDGWLTVWLTFAILFILKSIRQKKVSVAVISGICLGASLLTKVPAVLAVPSLAMMSLYHLHGRRDLPSIIKQVSISVLVGLGMFACLRINPAFSQLFTRGGDFLFSVSDIFRGIWLTTIQNTPSYVSDFWHYATPPVAVLFLVSLVLRQDRKRSILLFFSFLLFCVPIALMGKVVFPRYLFPAMIFITASAALAVEGLWQYKNRLLKWSGMVSVGLSLVYSLTFLYPLITNPNKTPFISADQGQYLTDWSAGHGTKEVAQKLIEASKTQKIAVATEGYFGSLPDGLLLYLNNENVSNIAVDGVGQPIGSIPEILIERRNEYDRLWLVVNSHRRTFDLPPNALLASYCRPDDSPCLELWDVTDIVHQLGE